MGKKAKLKDLHLTDKVKIRRRVYTVVKIYRNPDHSGMIKCLEVKTGVSVDFPMGATDEIERA